MPPTRKPPRKPNRATLSDELRDCVERDGRAPHAIALEAGISPACLSRFLAGKRGMTTETLDALAATLGLHLTAPSRPRGRPRREISVSSVMTETIERSIP